jgi:hypothetical protein
MIRVELVFPKDLNNQDILWLTLGCQNSIDDVRAVDQVDSALAGRSGIYRVSGDAEGVFVLTHAGEKMMITAMAGKNFLKCFEKIHEEICAAAAACGAFVVAGFVTRKGLATLYKQKTKARFAEYFEEELT